MSEPAAHPMSGSAGLPSAPLPLTVSEDLTDEVTWRRFQAQHLAAQTLAVQRTEWYAKSIRLSLLVLTFLAVVGVILGLVLGLSAGGDDPTMYRP